MEGILAAARERLQALPAGEQNQAWREAIQRRITLAESLLATWKSRQDLEVPADNESRRQQLEDALEEELQRPVEETVALSSLDQLTEIEEAAAAARSELTAAERRLESLRSERREAQDELASMAQRAAVAEQQSQQGEAERGLEGGALELDDYRAATARLETVLLGERGAYLNEVLPRWRELEALYVLERDLATAQSERAQTRLRLARRAAVEIRETEAARAEEAALRQAEEAERERDPLARWRRRIEAEIARRNARAVSLESKLDLLKDSIEEEREENQRLTEERQRLDRRLELRRQASELVLRQELEWAESELSQLRRVTLPELDTQSASIQQELLHVLERRWLLQRLDDQNEELAALLAELPEGRRSEARRLFDTSTHGRDGLIAALRQQRQLLEQVESRNAEALSLVVQRTNKLESFAGVVRAQLLWVPTEPVLDHQVAVEAVGELRALFGPEEPTEIQPAATEISPRTPRPVLAVLLFALAAGLLAWTSRRHRSVAKWLQAGPLPGAQWEVLLWPLWIALGPLAVLAASGAVRALALAPLTSAFLLQVLRTATWLLLAQRTAATLFSPAGPGVRHLGIKPDVGRQCLGAANFLTISALLFFAPMRSIAAEELVAPHLRRVLELAWLVTLDLLTLLLLRPGGALVRHSTERASPGRRVTLVLSALVFVHLFASLLLGILGYATLSRLLVENSLRFLATLVAVLGLYRLGMRLLDLLVQRAERRLGEQADERVVDRATLLRTGGRVSLILALTVLVVALQQLWGLGSLLAVVLRRIQLFQVSEGDWLTLADVFAAILWIAGGHLVVFNLNRIYENLVTPFVRSEKQGSRFVLLTISKYVIFLLAYGAALLSLRFSLASIGWLLTAVSVGLGFGLQEIVANFVSGLILLVEQPIRVGDIIEVGNTSGTVDKINIRATVVTNWERQTIIVPNKNFVTQNLTNWTRQDRIMRRTIKLGVAYGSDVEKVLRVLDEEVKAHPDVLAEPPWRIWFQGFGDYRLEFEVWFFTHIDAGLRTRAELNRRIYDRLRREGIEVPVITRDVHAESSQGESGEIAPQPASS